MTAICKQIFFSECDKTDQEMSNAASASIDVDLLDADVWYL